MGFRLASESMTLNDLERPNDLRCALSLRQLSFLSRMVAGVCVHLSDLLVYVRWALLLELNYVDLHMLNKRPYTHTATETATTDWTFFILHNTSIMQIYTVDLSKVKHQYAFAANDRLRQALCGLVVRTAVRPLYVYISFA